MLAGLTEWLDAYGRAWEERDPDSAAELFSEDAVYQWGPFGQRLHGRPFIKAAWAEATETQRNVAFGYEVMSASARGGLVRWWSAYDQPDRVLRVRIEGIFRLAFDENGLCKSLEEWFNADEAPLDGAQPDSV